jgi:hypothetical protein
VQDPLGVCWRFLIATAPRLTQPPSHQSFSQSAVPQETGNAQHQLKTHLQDAPREGGLFPGATAACLALGSDPHAQAVAAQRQPCQVVF